MTKAGLVQDLLQKLENNGVHFPSWVCLRSGPEYWKKNPAGYVFDDVQGEDLTTHYTVESQFSCFSKPALIRLCEFPIPEDVTFTELWQLWGRNGLFTMSPTTVTLNKKTYLQLRHNLFVSYNPGGFVASHDASDRHVVCVPCNTMHKSIPYLALLSKKNQACMGIYWSYLVQALAPWEEFPYLLRYNPLLLGNFLITMERENPDGYPRPVKGEIPAYALPQYVRCLSVEEQKLRHQVSLIDSGEFGQLSFGDDRVSLRVHQTDGDHIYSFDFPEWTEEYDDWDWNTFFLHWDSEYDLTQEEYNQFMWYRLAVLLLGFAGISYGPDKFYTQQSKKLKFQTAEAGLPAVRDIQDLEILVNKFE